MEITQQLIAQMIEDALNTRESRNAFDTVSLIPYHEHTGTDSPKVDYNNLKNTPASVSALWTLYQSFTWSSQAVAQSFTSLPAHDMWMIMFSLSGGANNTSFGIRLNNITTASYNTINIGTSVSYDTANTYGRVFDLNAVNYIGGQLTIDGRLRNSLLGYSAQPLGNSTSSSGNNRLFSGAVAAAADLSQISILQVGGTSTNFTGKGNLYYFDF